MRYDDENANREEAQNAATGLAGKQNTAGSGRTLLPATAEKVWQGIGREKQEQIIDQLDLYTYISEEADLYLFGSADASSLDARTNILEETAKQFYAAMHADRVLLENDGRFRWLGENISLLIKDIESIEAGTFSIDEDFEQYQQRHKVLTNREVLEMAMNDLQLSDLTPGERTALDILKGRLEHLKDLQGQRKQQGQLRTPVAISGKARFQNGWTKVGQNWYKNSGYFYCPESVQCTVCSL